MSSENIRLQLPAYDNFVGDIAVLDLPISASELHGMLCGYLCAGSVREGEFYMRALLGTKKSESLRLAALAMFNVYSISQQQLTNLGFEFQMLLPIDEDSLHERAKAFSEWCEGFAQGLSLSGVNYEDLEEEESQDALQHITEFAELDYASLDIGEGDEKALMEVQEYARMAVLRLHGELMTQSQEGSRHLAH